MSKRVVLTGNHAAAYACKAANVEVVAAYPITPQSPVVEKISDFVDMKEMPHTQFVTVESEQSAITAVVAASATGSRVFTATSANGLEYMYEMLSWAAGSRLPLVMCIATRALGAPWSVWTDHQDAFSVRDTGFMNMFCEDNQEIYDTILMAYRIAEDPRVFLPAFVSYDGYILSHTSMPVELEDAEKVKEFLPDLQHHIGLAKMTEETSEWKGVNPVTTPDIIPRPGEKPAPGYFEYRYSMQKANEYAFEVIEEVAAEFEEKFGRKYGNGIYKTHRIDDAETVLFGVGSIASECRDAVEDLREQGIKAGLVSLKVYRPFPVKYLREVFKNAEMIVVFDRDIGYGYEGILSNELKSALYAADNHPIVKGYILGLGGRDVTKDQIRDGVIKAINTENKEEMQRDTHTDYLGLKLEELGFKKEEK